MSETIEQEENESLCSQTDVPIEKKVDGLFYFPVVPISLIEETNLLSWLVSQPWQSITSSLYSRQVLHYGIPYDYKTKKIHSSLSIEPLPIQLHTLRSFLHQRALEWGNLESDQLDELKNNSDYFNQCIVNRYQPGQGISLHIDSKQFGPIIGCFTFGSGATISFKKEFQTVDYYMESSSLYMLTGEARTVWKHCMANRKNDIINGKKIERKERISITFRHVDIK